MCLLQAGILKPGQEAAFKPFFVPDQMSPNNYYPGNNSRRSDEWEAGIADVETLKLFNFICGSSSHDLWYGVNLQV